MRLQRLGLLFLLSLSFILLGDVISLRAAPPSNVTLAYFRAVPLDNAVRLEWGTDTEISTAGFFFERGQNGNFIYLEEIGIVNAEGGVVSGADYEAIDDTVIMGQVYTYKLYEIETNGNEKELSKVTIDLAPTPTPIQIGGPDPTDPPPTHTPRPSNTPTRRPTNTATPQATNTPRGGQEAATTTPRPTNTAVPSNTPTRSVKPTATSPLDPTATPTGSGAPILQPTSTPAPPVAPSPTLATGVASGAPAETPSPTPAPENVVYAQDAAAPAGTTPRPINGQQRLNTQPQNERSGSAAAATATPNPDVVNRGRLFLWGGFLLALLVFAASIIGSIILFTRKQYRS